MLFRAIIGFNKGAFIWTHGQKLLITRLYIVGRYNIVPLHSYRREPNIMYFFLVLSARLFEWVEILIQRLLTFFYVTFLFSKAFTHVYLLSVNVGQNHVLLNGRICFYSVVLNVPLVFVGFNTLFFYVF